MPGRQTPTKSRGILRRSSLRFSEMLFLVRPDRDGSWAIDVYDRAGRWTGSSLGFPSKQAAQKQAALRRTVRRRNAGHR